MAVIASRRAVVLGAEVAVPAVAATAWFARDTAGFAEAGTALHRPLGVAPTGPARFAELVRFATLAPNSHNTQAWRFSGDAAQITISPDPARATPAVDPDRHHTFVSVGAAAETLGLAATAYGLNANPTFDPSSGSIIVSLTPGAPLAPPLNAVAQRQSNGSGFDGTRFSAAAREASVNSVASFGVAFHLTQQPAQKAALMGVTTGHPSILLRRGRATPMPFALRRPSADLTL